MAQSILISQKGYQLSAFSKSIWRIVQTTVWAIGVFILYCLFFYQPVGLLIFWNILIPVAPALLVLAPGVWRNVCPLATTNLLPRHLNLSRKKKLSPKQLGVLNLIAVITLYTIVPLRHSLLNNSGTYTALVIILMAGIGVFLGFFYEWKSVWCSGLCPVHPVEKLYGENVLITVPNAHCDKCMKCVTPCPDSTPNINPNTAARNIYHKITAFLIVGGLPGFIWGWFHVPDQKNLSTITSFLAVYEMPFIGLIITLFFYLFLLVIVKTKHHKKLTALFAAAGVACYYWYRIPSLFGFGIFSTDGVLFNVRNIAPAWIFPVLTVSTTIFFFYWLVWRKPNKQSWLNRPQFAKQIAKTQTGLRSVK